SVKISKRQTSVPGWGSRIQTSFGGQRLPLPACAQIAKYRVGLLDIHTGLRNRFHMPARDEQIFPTIVVKVIKAGAIARHGAAELPHPAGIGNFLESLAGLVPVDGKG